MKRHHSDTHNETSRSNTKRSKNTLYASHMPGEIWQHVWNNLDSYKHISQDYIEHKIIPDIFALKITCKYFYHNILGYLKQDVLKRTCQICAHNLFTTMRCFIDGKLNYKIAEYYAKEIFDEKGGILSTDSLCPFESRDWIRCVRLLYTYYNDKEGNEVQNITKYLLSDKLICEMMSPYQFMLLIKKQMSNDKINKHALVFFVVNNFKQSQTQNK